MNHKKLRRLYAEERLQVRRRGGRKVTIRRRPPRKSELQERRSV
jgi:putative transposase